MIAEADTAVDHAASMFGVADVPGGLALSPADPGESSSLMLAPEPGAIRSKADVDAERRAWLQRQRRIWLGLSIAQSTGAMLDAWSTRRVVASGRGQETNALLRPFAGNGSMYAAIQVGPLLLDYVSRRMMTSQHTVLRRDMVGPAGGRLGGVLQLFCKNARRFLRSLGYRKIFLPQGLARWRAAAAHSSRFSPLFLSPALGVKLDVLPADPA